MLDEIMGRLGRIEATTHDLRGLIEAMPSVTAGTTVTTVPATVPATLPTAPPAPAKLATPACPKPVAPISDQNSDDGEESDTPAAVTVTLPQLGVISLSLLALIAGLLRRRAQPETKNAAQKSTHKPISKKTANEEIPLRNAPLDADSIPSWVPDISHATSPGQASTNRSLTTPPAQANNASSPQSSAPGSKLAANVPNAANPALPMINAAGYADSFDPTLELAEIMLSMGMASSAAQALEEHIRENPREALMHWLKLLEVYRKDGHRSDFEKAASELQKSFNIRAADWLKSSGEIKTLEDFPRVIQEVVTLWPEPQACLSYLYHLLEDNREGVRLGFPQSAAEDILLLIGILKSVYHIEIPPQVDHAAPSLAAAQVSEATQ